MITKIKSYSNGKLFNQLSVMNLSRNQRFTSTGPSKTSGKWYYEMTHYQGFNFDYAGYRHNNVNNQIVYYTFGSLDNPYYYISGMFKGSGIYTNQLGFPIERQHTVGVGIDLDNKVFSVFYNDTVKHIDIELYQKGKAINIDFGCGDREGSYYDVISVNFGAAPFIYKADGYRAWSSPLSFSKCPLNKHEFFSKCALMCIIALN